MSTNVTLCDDERVVISFDGFKLDIDGHELSAAGDPIPMEPQVFDVLVHLIRHADRVVTKNELLDEVWGSRFVSESAITTRIKTLRQALGDDGRAQRLIRTVHGRGYRFVADITEQPDGTADAPTDTRAHGDTGDLPIDRTPLFGRDDDIARTLEAIDEHRLVTLLGIGGTGKTRLAIAAAREATTRFPDGVWFVDLVPVSDADGLDLALVAAAGLSVGAGASARDRITDLLAERRALVVLDNAEHVVDEVAALLDHLLSRTRAPGFLVTSRAPLGLLDEQRLPIDPLAVDDDSDDGGDEAPAVMLLRSAAKRFGASLDGTDPAVIRRLCRSLDGLPLAIELAAAQLRHLDVDAVADRLDRRFDVLSDRAHPDRHASLQVVLGDTWDWLDSAERALLEQLGAFPSTFTLDDVCAVADAAGEALTNVEFDLGGLVDRSLVVRETVRRSRYRLLETVKLFARQQCDVVRTQAVFDTHAQWCLDAVGVDPRRYLFDFELAEWCGEHLADLRRAHHHLRANDRFREAAQLSAAMALMTHFDSGAVAAVTLELAERDLESIDDDALEAALHFTGVMCAMATRSPEAIADHGTRGLAVARRTGDPVLVNAALVLASWSTVFVDPELALAQTAEAGDIAAAADERRGRDFADGYRAFHLGVLRRYDEAEGVARAVLARAPLDERLGYSTYVAAEALAALLCVDEPEEALEWSDDEIASPSSSSAMWMWSRELSRATSHASAGDVAEAAEAASTILARLESAGHEPWPDLLLPPVARAVAIGDLERARLWLESIRTAGRPTQSFQATIMYRRLRDAVGDTRTSAPEADVEAIGREALTWLAGGA